MRDYGKVLPTFWTGDTGRLLRDAGRDAQLVALYLLTGPSANMIGLYHLPLPLLCHHLGLKPEGALKALQRVVETGFASFEARSETIFVPHMARIQIGEVLQVKDNRHKNVVKELRNWRKSLFVKDFCSIYGDTYSLPDDIYIEAPSKPLTKPLRSQEQEQEQEQELEQDTPKPPKGADACSAFEQFWREFPKGRKQGKELARKAFRQALKKSSTETILAAVREYAASPVASGKFVKGPAPWLNQGCWDDDRAAWQRSETGEPPSKAGQPLSAAELETYNPVDGGGA
jgi:hypothetical protein